MENQVLLGIYDLHKYFPFNKGVFKRHAGDVKAVDGVDLEILSGETLGLVGESGCGKSTLGRTILRLTEPTGGDVKMEGESVLSLSNGEMRAMRRRMQIVFQDPYASLNPRMTIEDIVGEPLKIHEPTLGHAARRERVVEMLRLVGLAEYALARYPHEFSGGQRQRVGIARALILHPKFVVCDEPVSALDVSVRSQVLNLMQELQQKMQLTYLFISHDLSVVKHISDRLAVMYLGKIVELSDKNDIYDHPLHPYTIALMSAIPIPDPDVVIKRHILEGDVPSPANPPQGCRFHTRCWKATERCRTELPRLTEARPGHYVACFHCEEATGGQDMPNLEEQQYA